mmetsp:Transcript_13618/g.20160  ORF Transcript_13618/g.20160 Transcript_13618/m.20160 type:complete len:371 (+) Transcript_13618:121-1233(+)
MELTLNIDEKGRTAAPSSQQTSASPLILDYTTKSTMFPHDSFDEKFCKRLIQDCKAAASSDDLPMTFWLSARDEPRCLLEKLAKDIFAHHAVVVMNNNKGSERAKNHHLGDMEFSNACGCEWWVQLRPSSNQKRINSNSKEAQRGIQFHWDKDETLRDVADVFVHPHLSTVTYLTDNGAPTLVFEESMPNERLLDKTAGTGIKGAFVSWPLRGKHLSFDGRLLHGAPSDLLRSSETDELRVTFLVNIWLYHKPLGIEQFPEAFLGRFSCVDDDGNGKHRKSAMETKTRIRPSNSSSNKLDVHVTKSSPNIRFCDFTWGLGDMLSIHSKLPVNIIRKERKMKEYDRNVAIRWDSNDFTFICNNEEPKKRTS